MEEDDLKAGVYAAYIDGAKAVKVRIKETRKDKSTNYKFKCLITFIANKNKCDEWVVARDGSLLNFNIFTDKLFGEPKTTLPSTEALRRHALLTEPDSHSPAVSDTGMTVLETDHISLITLPTELIEVVLEDYKAICLENKWLKVPLEYSIYSICREYIKYIALDQGPTSLTNELVRRYVDFARNLPVLIDSIYNCDRSLLYSVECHYFDEAVKNLPTHRTLSHCIGLSHLLRFIMKIPQPPNSKRVPKHLQDHVTLTRELVAPFVDFLVQYKHCFFNVSEDYIVRKK